MADKDVKALPLLLLKQKPQSEAFTPKGSGGGAASARNIDRTAHGAVLLQQFHALAPTFEQAIAEQQKAGLDESLLGHRLVFESPPDVLLALDSLSRDKPGIELLNTVRIDNRQFATVFVPDGQLTVFEQLVGEYLDPDKDKKLPANAALLETIQAIRVASFESLWTDTKDALPNPEEVVNWEVWLPVRKARRAIADAFREQATAVGLLVSDGLLEFPERSVLQARGTRQQFERSMLTLNHVAELRRAKESADFFDAIPQNEQYEWVDDLLQRSTFASDSAKTPYVCILDTGARQAHPLISPALSHADQHSNNASWGVHDNEGHGTAMAGLALWGDLSDPLASHDPIALEHRLETVKILDTNNSGGYCPEHHGYLSAEAVARPEIDYPHRLRVFSLAITAKDNRDAGRPSAWSATLDRLACDVENEGLKHKLFIVSAGNIDDANLWEVYPASNTTDGIHDPAQAWNVLTVGAFTQKTTIEGDLTDNYQVIAPCDGLSPFSTTSASWNKNWPLKPEVVFEGGNAAIDDISASSLPCLELLTTSHLPNRLLTTSNATSAATALAARFASTVMAEYPHLWPETVRALTVHSARWTDTMRKQFLPNPNKPSKTDVVQLIRHCGYGVPSLEKAVQCKRHALTIVTEHSIQPFSADAKMNAMHLHALPWPNDELAALADTQVEMRVTLSYFIEPNPSARGYNSRYSYQSHGLRFDVRRAQESTDEFRVRINKRAKLESEQSSVSSSTDNNWLVGSSNRSHGTLHCDIWRGNAADLAERGVIAVFPTAGWWKHRKALGHTASSCQYALLISIETPENLTDIYTPVATSIEQLIDVDIL